MVVVRTPQEAIPDADEYTLYLLFIYNCMQRVVKHCMKDEAFLQVDNHHPSPLLEILEYDVHLPDGSVESCTDGSVVLI